MITFILNKLARDKTLVRMEKAGITCKYKIVQDQELLDALREKIMMAEDSPRAAHFRASPEKYREE